MLYPVRNNETAFSDVYEKLAAFIFPSKCLSCGDFFRNDRHSIYMKDAMGELKGDVLKGPSGLNLSLLMGASFCHACSGGIEIIRDPICRKCGTVFWSKKGDGRTCGDCIKRPMPYGIARSATVFQDSMIDAVHTFKYSGKLQLEKPLSIILFSAFLYYLNDFLYKDGFIDLIIPVPLHSKRFRSRGFNQAYLLARNFRDHYRLYGSGKWKFSVDTGTLLRKRNTQSQVGLGKVQRRQNIRNAFFVNSSSDIQGKRILLVDDVYTTGATVEECSRVLLKGGALTVDVLTLSRAV